MDDDSLREIIQQAGLSKQATEIMALMQNSIRLKANPVDEATLQRGASKLGGLPDLPPEIAWPEVALATGNDKVALALIVQLNMSAVAAYDSEQLLPPTGMLYFFYQSMYQDLHPYADNPSDWRVIYYDGDLSQLERRAAPANLPPENRFLACAVEFTSQPTLPDANSPKLDGWNWLGLNLPRLKLDKAEMKAYEDALYPIHMEMDTHLLGYAGPIQSDVLTEAYLSSVNVSYSQLEGSTESEKLQAVQEEGEWMLLLQVDSEDDAQMMWGDAGRIYFCIRKQELTVRNFANVWVVFQCG